MACPSGLSRPTICTGIVTVDIETQVVDGALVALLSCLGHAFELCENKARLRSIDCSFLPILTSQRLWILTGTISYTRRRCACSSFAFSNLQDFTSQRYRNHAAFPPCPAPAPTKTPSKLSTRFKSATLLLMDVRG